MAWLFGSVKKSRPEVYVSREVEGGFDVVSTGPPPTPLPRFNIGGVGNVPQASSYRPGYPLYPTLPQAQYPAPGPYSNPPYLAICPQAPPGYKPQPSHPLDSIPFKLSAGLDTVTGTASRKILSELEKIRSSLSQLTTRLDSSEYTYSFELERSVLREEIGRN